MIVFQIITQFPERYEIFFKSGLPAKAISKKLIQIYPIQLRDFADLHRKGRVDDSPYGGGPGMVLQVGPIYRALEALPLKLPVILLSPSGERLTQELVRSLSSEAIQGNCNYDSKVQNDISGGFTILCGYYEGVDQRVADHFVDRQISIGDFVLNSGDAAAICLIEAISRLIPGFMGSDQSEIEESFERLPNDLDNELLVEYPQYSRPADFMGFKVPEVLLSGHHGQVQKWRMEQRLKRTKNRGNYEH